MNELNNRRGTLVNFCDNVAKDGGCSYNYNTGLMNPNKGYMVSLDGCEEISKRLTKEVLTGYIVKHARDIEINDNIFIGAWQSDNNIYLDLSINIDSLEKAWTQGMLNGQLAIWDCENSKEIQLPAGQGGGTYQQKIAYAQMKFRNYENNY